ncbi:unnamed protein product [Cyclocybe aegerita]|uniref:SET domain-containing protein n=1 Tax=Cyclocybe aegerita TaxID=1973307 RepID=A0A8S0XCX0_CYCAE|nr:unnamed protein product [Cyclocybe aegerita]
MFDSFAWQTEIQDPDRETIQLEVARRLYFDGLSFRDIDKLKILTTSLRIDESAGLIWSASQRDLLLWPGSQMTALPALPTKFVNPRLNIHENVMKDRLTFCPNLNCLSSRCHIHKEAIPIELPKPTVTNVMIKDSVGEPCDRDCFRTYDLDYFIEDNKWDDEAISLFNSIIKLVPDAEPCDLAVLCRMPCIEMYVQRSKTFSDVEIQENLRASNDDIQPRALDIVFEEDCQANPEDWQPPVPPCNHAGACSQSANCACYNDRKRCRRNCRCSETCALRAKGCKCGSSKKGKTCSEDSNCPCRRAHRECDPELCISCDARCSKRGRRCQNNQIQQARYLPIRVSTGMFGLGAFAETDIPAHKYIGEYFGEIFSEQDSMDFITQVQKHTGLNYAFSLARGVQLDSYTVGNEMRYLNHSSIPNCRARIICVNGDPRIVLETEQDVKEGQELFLDYGPLYWSQGAPAHDDDDRE